MNKLQKGNTRAHMNKLQKIGGIAAQGHAISYIVGIVLAFAFIFPVMDAGTNQYMDFVTNNRILVHIWILICYWGAGGAFVIMALALYERLKQGSPILMQISTAFGLIWAGLIIGSANLMIYDFGVIADLHGKNPDQAATVWLALKSVENGIVSGNEFVGSLWLLLLSFAALRTRELTRGLNYFGVLTGIAGLLTLIPALTETIGIMFFGLGMIVWSIWVGIVMLRNKPRTLIQQ
jgi:hypothetical protein